jgi:hypothetical protein
VTRCASACQRRGTRADQSAGIHSDRGAHWDDRRFGEWVFWQAAGYAARWRKIYPDFQLSVNVSPAQFQRTRGVNFKWPEHLPRRKQAEQDMPMEILVEITEGLLLDASAAVTNQLLAFRDAGIQVSLDDFGTGYSSLSYLRKFDIDYLKSIGLSCLIWKAIQTTRHFAKQLLLWHISLAYKSSWKVLNPQRSEIC